MIRLTKLNGSTILLNSDLIERVEQTADTIIVLINGETLRVAERMEDIRRNIIQFRREAMGGYWPGALTSHLTVKDNCHAETEETDRL